MKIEIRHRPYFRLPMPVPVIEALMTMANAHYDGTCRQTGRVGGFIYGWNNHAAFEPDATVVEVDAAPRELDLCMKICELQRVTPLTDEQRQMLTEFRTAVGLAMVEAKVWDRAPLVGITDM